MHFILSLSALALFSLVQPAAAQMCGGGQQAQGSTAGQQGGMCGMGQAGQAADDPMADKPAQAPKSTGMCPCCKNMAMMRGGMGGMQHHNMPGMEMPKQ